MTYLKTPHILLTKLTIISNFKNSQLISKTNHKTYNNLSLSFVFFELIRHIYANCKTIFHTLFLGVFLHTFIKLK